MWVTGASDGMGRATTLALAARGETVVAVARRADVLAEVAGLEPDRIELVVGDVAATDTVERIVATVQGRPVLGLVHGAAGPVELTAWRALGADELTRQFRVHVAAPIAITGALLAAGTVERVILFDSYSATTPRVGWAAYSILKSAAQMAFRAAAAELDDITVVRVFPGAVDTPLLQRVLDASPTIEATTFYRELVATGKVSDAADIGRSIAELIVDVDVGELTETWSLS